MSSFTLEERFLLELAKLSKSGNSVALTSLCSALSLHPQKANTIAKALHRGNFLRKDREDFLLLTEHGRKLVALLLE